MVVKCSCVIYLNVYTMYTGWFPLLSGQFVLTFEGNCNSVVCLIADLVFMNGNILLNLVGNPSSNVQITFMSGYLLIIRLHSSAFPVLAHFSF